jgi:TldD protein
MSNTYIKEGDASYDEILETCKNGVLLIGSRGGQVDPGRGVFQFNAKYGYLIENGETTSMLRDVSLSGDILSVLHNIALCGKERKMSSGMCGKGQAVLPVEIRKLLGHIKTAVRCETCQDGAGTVNKGFVAAGRMV